MQRTKVFLSYSHQDEKFLQAFRVYLKFFEDQVWSAFIVSTL